VIQTPSLFDPVVPEHRLSTAFLSVKTGRGYAPGRTMIDRLFGELGDRDGNFREQFQTSGFDARIWELCVYGLLVESGFHLERDHATPDFVVNKDGVELALEVTTANLSAADDPSDFEPESEQEILLHTSERLPIKQ
jgi:hypothetical protein